MNSSVVSGLYPFLGRACFVVAIGCAASTARRDRRGARRRRRAGPGDRKTVSRWADQISDGAWAAESVRRAVKAAQAAVAASTAAVVTASTAASS